jgi:hypothetical protein
VVVLFVKQDPRFLNLIATLNSRVIFLILIIILNLLGPNSYNFLSLEIKFTVFSIIIIFF